MAQLVERNRQTSSGLAASYVRNMRRSQKVKGDFELQVAEPLIVDQFAASLHTVSVAALKRSTGQGVPESVALTNALTETRGSMARLVLDAGRQTIVQTTVADPRAGWIRVGDGATCDWCRQYLDGEVHYVEGYDFAAHDHCGCTAEPVFE